MHSNVSKPFSWFQTTAIAITLVLGVALSTGTKMVGAQESVSVSPTLPLKTSCAWVGSQASPLEKAHQVLDSMTLDEKITMLGLARSPDGYENFIPAIPRLCIPRLILQDGPAGVAAGFRDVTQLPAPIALAASWDRAAATAYGTIQGKESWAKGIEVAQGPDVNIARVPQNGRLFEAYGEDPYLVSQMAVANIKAIQATGVMANAKHFAGNNQETKRLYINDVVSERALREIYFPAFRAAVKDADVATVMCAYNKVNGHYSCANSYLLTDVLENEWGFKGFIRSDLGAVHDVAASYNAGMDQSKPQHNAELKLAVQNGQVPLSRIDDAVTRILSMMFTYNLFDNPPTGTPKAIATNPQHAEIARSIAAQGTVLLKNADNVLPLNTDKIKSIAVIGKAGDSDPQTNGGGSSSVKPPYVITPYRGIRIRAGSGVAVTYTQGTDRKKAVDAATAADVAVVFAKSASGEGKDQSGLLLPEFQDELISAVAQANPNTIVVLYTGNPVRMPWLDQVKGVIEGWYAGQEAGNAIAEVLFGDVNPSGKLPVTFPKNEIDNPAHTPQQWPGVNGNAEYSEDLLVGYRWYDEKSIEPLFPFGFGLSYTTFLVNHLEVYPQVFSATEHLTVTADVTNTGDRPGAEVVQLYVGMPTLANEPPKQLKGFQKVLLKPGETERVTFSLDKDDLSFWDSKAHDWVMPAGDYNIMVGTSSRDIVASSTIRVDKATGVRYVTTTAPPIVEPSSSVTVAATFTNESSYSVHDTTLQLVVPEGWYAQPKGRFSFGTVLPGESVSALWIVSVPAQLKPGEYRLTASADYQAPDGGQHSADTATLWVPYNRLAEAFNNIGITDNSDHTPGDFDGDGNSYSAQALADVGITPGAQVTTGDMKFTWPNVPAGRLDNVLMEGQVLRLSGSGRRLGILGASEQGTFSGTGTVFYTDGTTQNYVITLPDWFASQSVPGTDLVVVANYLNRTNGKPMHIVSLFVAYVPLLPDKTVKYVELPHGRMHAFDVAIE